MSWPVETKKAINSAVLGIRIFKFFESGLEEKMIVETTVRFLDHIVCTSPFI